jgi:hypothetical protein
MIRKMDDIITAIFYDIILYDFIEIMRPSLYFVMNYCNILNGVRQHTPMIFRKEEPEVNYDDDNKSISRNDK